MDAKVVSRGMEDHKKHSLGQRAFLLFLARRIHWCVYLFLIAWVAWYSERWIPVDYFSWAEYATKILFLLTGALFLMVFFRTYMEYRYYTYFFTEEAFIMTYGYIVRNEIATVYHQIQNVNIERSILDRMIGVSKIIILMTGSDRDAIRNQIILPAVGRTKARLVQKELLMRARKHSIPTN